MKSGRNGEKGESLLQSVLPEFSSMNRLEPQRRQRP